MQRIDKNRPTPEWIAQLRERLPCETEMDRVLTRKLQRRAGPPYTPVSLDTLIQGTDALIRSQIKPLRFRQRTGGEIVQHIDVPY